jgi:hypothetical protein
MSGINDILLRYSSHSGLSTKGSEITFAEEDNNFIVIYEALKALNNGAGLTPYNAGTTYTGTQYVSYGGNIYVHIAPTSIGQTPSTSPSVWQITTIGQLAHVQGTDMTIGTGSAYALTVQQIFETVVNIIDISFADFMTAIATSSLKAGKTYKISDSLPTKVSSIFIQSFGGNSFSTKAVVLAHRILGVPAYDPEATYATDDVVCWNDITYQNGTGDNAGVLPPDDSLNWFVTPDANFQLPVSVVFELNIYDGILILSGECPFTGNTFTQNSFYEGFPPLYDNASISLYANNMYNECSEGSIAYAINARTPFLGNRLRKYSFIGLDESFVSKGSGTGISGNDLENALIVAGTGTTVKGSIGSNILKNVVVSFPDGMNDGAIMSSATIALDTQKTLHFPADFNASDFKITEEGSNLSVALNVTGMTEVDVAAILGHTNTSCFGVLRLQSSNPTETIRKIILPEYALPIKIVADGTDIVFDATAPSGLSDDNKFTCTAELDSIGVLGITLSGTHNDSLKLVRRSINGYTVYEAVEANIFF